MTLLFMLFWIILNGRLAVDVLLTGAAVTVLMLVCVCALGGWSLKKELKTYKLIPKGCVYFVCLVKEIFIANIETIKIIFKGGNEPCIRSFKTRLNSSAARTMLANSITMTPGTVTVQLNGDTLTVHCLSRELADGLTDSLLENRLLEMEEHKNDSGV